MGSNVLKSIFNLLKSFFIVFVSIFSRKKILKKTQNNNFRGRHFLDLDDFAKEKCIACKLCEAVCSAGAIKIKAISKNGKNYAESYQIDLGKCCYCGLCVQACPVNAINMSAEIDDAYSDKNEQIVSKKTLLKRRYKKYDA
jgi:NADH-quinone oxidoreductase subunit I